METAKFGGHEGFPMRAVWPLKIVQALEFDSMALIRKDASVILGVGKNMITSMRYWGTMCGIIENDAEAKRGMTPSELGRLLFGSETGLDPYLENPVTSWILHRQLVLANGGNSAFGWFFGQFSKPSFDSAGLCDALISDMRRQKQLRSVSPNTVKKDIEVLVRSYLPPQMNDKSVSAEDLAFMSPFADLALLRHSHVGPIEFNRPVPTQVPVELLLMDIRQYWKSNLSSSRTTSFESLMFAQRAPGRRFVMKPAELVTALENLDTRGLGLRYDETAGVGSISIDSNFGDPSDSELISMAYGQSAT